MANIPQKEQELSSYITEWYNARYQNWYNIYSDIYKDRRDGIYKLNHGSKLLDYLISIISNLEEHFSLINGQHLIPSRFSSIGQLCQFLQNFTKYLHNNYHLVESNIDGENTNEIVISIAKMVMEIINLSERCIEVSLEDDNIPISYQQLKRCLYSEDIQHFSDLLNSIIKSVPYLIRKNKFNEGYFHSFFHVALTMIGMNPLSEVATSDGRIDMVIDCPKFIYIMEFKYSPKDIDLSGVALKQIKDKKYHLPYIIQQKQIIGVGFVFGEEARQVTNYKKEVLYTPSINLKLGNH